MRGKRFPTLDEQEQGHSAESAYLMGDLDAMDAAEDHMARESMGVYVMGDDDDL